MLHAQSWNSGSEKQQGIGKEYIRRTWILIYEEDGEPLPPETAGREYSGKFVLRVGKELHKKIAIKALQAGESLNSHCVQVLEKTQKS